MFFGHQPEWTGWILSGFLAQIQWEFLSKELWARKSVLNLLVRYVRLLACFLRVIKPRRITFWGCGILLFVTWEALQCLLINKFGLDNLCVPQCVIISGVWVDSIQTEPEGDSLYHGFWKNNYASIGEGPIVFRLSRLFLDLICQQHIFKLFVLEFKNI